MQQANCSNIIIGPWARPPRSNAAARVSDDEALFLRSLFQIQNHFGRPPIAELGLPKSIRLVVDYALVKQLIHATLARGGYERENEYRERLSRTAKQARLRLVQMGIVGCEDPFVWFTGQPVRGFPETMQRVRTQSA